MSAKAEDDGLLWLRYEVLHRVEIIEAVLGAVERREWSQVKTLLHPYLHWKEPGVAIRGRTKVLARLAAGPLPGAPSSCELRDGQVYRWSSM